jgi:hypothetical protein
VWEDGVAQAAVSLDEGEAARLATFLSAHATGRLKKLMSVRG